MSVEYYDIYRACYKEYDRGEAFYAAGQYDNAIAAFEAALEIIPNSECALHGKGNALRMKAQYDEALFFLNKALKIHPKNVASLTHKASILVVKGRYDEALLILEMALKLNPSFSLAHASKGVILRERKDYDEAIICFNTALMGKANNRSTSERKNLAWEDNLLDLSYKASSLALKGQHDNAIVLCDQILCVYHNNILSWKIRGFALGNKGDYVGAIDCYNAALKVEPDDSWTLEQKALAISRVKYPTPFKRLVDSYDKILLHPNKRAARAGMVAAASDTKKSVIEQLRSILQNLFKLKIHEAEPVKSESGDMSVLLAQDCAEEILLQNLLDVWGRIPNKKIEDQIKVIECLNDLYINVYCQEGWLWFSEDSWLSIQKTDTDRILTLLLESVQILQGALEQKKPSLLIQSHFEVFILLLLKIEAGFTKDHKKQGVQKRYLLNGHHSELKALIDIALYNLWENIFNGDVWSFKRFIMNLQKKEKDQFYALHQKQLGRKYLGTYCSILPQMLCNLSSFVKAELTAQQAMRPPPLPPGVVTAEKAPSSPSAVNPQKNILLNRIGFSDDDSKIFGDIPITRKEIEPNFDHLNSYYSADFINLLLYPLKESDSENIAICPATTLEEYPKYFDDKGAGTEKQRYVFIPLHVFFDLESPGDRNHWAALIIDKEEQIIFYLDPATKSTPQAVEALKAKLNYKNAIVINTIDFQVDEKAKDQSIRHCGVYVVEIFRAFVQCIRNKHTVIDTERPIKNLNEQPILLKNVMNKISYGLEEAAVHRKNHIEQVNNLLRTLPEAKQTNPTIPEAHPKHPNVCLVPELEDKSHKSLNAFCEVLVGKLESRRTTSEVMSSGIISYSEKGNWAKIKKFGWLLLKSAPFAGKVMKYGHLGCQMAGEVLGNLIEGASWEIDEAPWIEPVTEYLENVKVGSKIGHSAIDFLHGHWESFRAKSEAIDGYFRKWIDGSEVNTAREYEQFRELFCTDAGKDALNRFVRSLIERYTRQLILLDEKEGAKQLAEAIDEHLGRLFLLNFEKWNLPQWGAQKHVMILEIMRQWVTYMGFSKENKVKLASGETTTAQALLQHCGVYLKGDKQAIEIDVIIDWDAGTHNYFISNASRYGHRKAECMLVEELKGHLQHGDELLQAYQKQFASQKTAKELEMLKELGHVMGIQFDHRTLRVFRDVKEIQSYEKETWKSLAEKTQANEEKLDQVVETVGEIKEDLGTLKGKINSLEEEVQKSKMSPKDTQKGNSPPANNEAQAQDNTNVSEEFVPITTFLPMKKRAEVAENNFRKANKKKAALITENSNLKAKIIEQNQIIMQQNEILLRQTPLVCRLGLTSSDPDTRTMAKDLQQSLIQFQIPPIFEKLPKDQGLNRKNDNSQSPPYSTQKEDKDKQPTQSIEAKPVTQTSTIPIIFHSLTPQNLPKQNATQFQDDARPVVEMTQTQQPGNL